MITKDELLDHLNKDLEKEFSAAIQYVQHAAVITGPEYQSILAELNIHADEEIGHAKNLSEQIAFLGGTPTVDVFDRNTSTDSTEMLNQDLEGELDAIARYKERITQADELGEHGLKKVLEDILIMEEEHARDLQTALGK